MTTTGKRRRPDRTGRARTAEPTLIEEYESDPAGAQELAAARFAVGVCATLAQALEAAGLKQAELAEMCSVTPGRVSQLLADGNLRVATIGKFARAMGYQARLVLDPVNEGLPVVTQRAFGGQAQVTVLSPTTFKWQVHGRTEFGGAHSGSRLLFRGDEGQFKPLLRRDAGAPR